MLHISDTEMYYCNTIYIYIYSSIQGHVFEGSEFGVSGLGMTAPGFGCKLKFSDVSRLLRVWVSTLSTMSPR